MNEYKTIDQIIKDFRLAPVGSIADSSNSAKGIIKNTEELCWYDTTTEEVGVPIFLTNTLNDINTTFKIRPFYSTFNDAVEALKQKKTVYYVSNKGEKFKLDFTSTVNTLLLGQFTLLELIDGKYLIEGGN